MHPSLEVAGTGLTALLLHPRRALVTAACVVAVLLPYLAGLGLSQGLQDEASAAVRFGADLYVSGEQFGRPVPVPLAAAEEVRKVPGVVDVVPRVVGRLRLGEEGIDAVLVGVPVDHFPAGLDCVEGRLYGGGPANELVVGSELARRLHLKVGSYLPPFYQGRGPLRVSQVVGIFRADVSPWQARLIVTSLETAAHIFDEPGLATDLLVWCNPGYQDDVSRALGRSLSLTVPGGTARPRVVTREEAAALLSYGPRQREGTFTLLFVLAFAVAILVVLVTSGFGLSERRREIAILKATGWQTDELLLRSLTESFLLSLGGAAVSVVLAFVWLRGLNGYWIAGVFLAGVDRSPGFRVPFRLTPVPTLLAFLIALVVVMSGSLYFDLAGRHGAAARGDALMDLLETRQLCKSYRARSAAEVRALHDVSLGVPAGSFTLLTGPSGSGKTTLLALLGGLERPTAGQVLFAGRDLGACADAELARLRRRMGFVFQDCALLPGLSAWENVTYPLIPRGVGRAERQARARALLERFGLAGRMAARPRELSGGEQQRVALARALAGDPEVLLADEPTSNLDEDSGRAVIDLLRQAHAAGKTVIASSHDFRLTALATRVGELAGGRLTAVRDGAPPAPG